MLRVIRVGAIGIAVIVLGAQSATAQSLSDPAPLINGDTPSKVVYTTTGVFDNANAATMVTCTSTLKGVDGVVLVAVEFYDNLSLSNDVTTGDGVTDLEFGDTDIIATRAVTNISVTETLTVAPTIAGTGALRVLANSTALICSAHVVEVATGNYLASLPMFKKTKQAGD